MNPATAATLAATLATWLATFLAPAPQPARAADPTRESWESLHDKARSRIADGDFTGALALLNDHSPFEGPVRLFPSPTNAPSLQIPDPATPGVIISVGKSWLATWNPEAGRFLRHVPFPEALTQLLDDLQLDVSPRDARIVENRLIVDFRRQSRQGGGSYGLFASFNAQTLDLQWLYDHDNDYQAWAVDEHTLAIGDEESGAVLGLALTNGVPAWENSRVRCGWTRMAAGEGLILTGGRDTLAAFESVTGKLLWKRQSPPVQGLLVAGSTVACTSRKGLAAFRLRTGEPIWSLALAPDDPPALTGANGAGLAVLSGHRLRLLDAATGAVTLDRILDGWVNPLAVAGDGARLYLRTDGACLTLDREGNRLHQVALPDDSRASRPVGSPTLLRPIPGGRLVDHLTGRVLNTADRITADDLLELQAACSVIARGQSALPAASRDMARAGRQFGSLLPAVLRALAAGDAARENALILANLPRSTPDARLHMLATLRQQAGLKWHLGLDAVPLHVSPSGHLLAWAEDETVSLVDVRTGRVASQLDPPAGPAGWVVPTPDGNHFVRLMDNPPRTACHEIPSGRLVWERELDLDVLDAPGAPGALAAPAAGAAANAATQALVLVGGWGSHIAALSPEDGALLWQQPLPPDRSPGSYVGLIPALHIFVDHWRLPTGSGGGFVLRGLDLGDGHERWRHEFAPGTWLSHRRFLAMKRYLSLTYHARSYPTGKTDTPGVRILDTWTGATTWQRPDPTTWPILSVNDLTICLSRSPEHDRLEAIESATGNRIFDRTFPAGTASILDSHFVDGRVFVSQSSRRYRARSSLIVDDEPRLGFDVRSNQSLGRMAIPGVVLSLSDDILVGATPDSRHVLAFDWKRLCQTAAGTSRTPDSRKGAQP